MQYKRAAKLFLVDDDEGFLKLLEMRFISKGFQVKTANSATQCLRELESYQPDLLISDLRMDKMDGLELFGKINEIIPYLPVIIITAHGSIPEAVKATQQGVFSFITKPIETDKMFQVIEQALRHGISWDKGGSWSSHIITQNQQLKDILNQVKLAAPMDSSIMIFGESGTGKEMLAKAIHNASRRVNGKFVAVNCGAIPANLFESELFGHVKGAFTGAIKNHVGLFQTAHNGTLFLDEIADMPIDSQVKLLRTFEDKTIKPVGSNQNIAVNVRVISATNKNIKELIENGQFREDLYYRLNVINFKIPPLRDRKEDIIPLAKTFLSKIAAKNKPLVKSFAPEALDLLMNVSWPGNVRQLYNAIERLVAFATKPIISKSAVEQAISIKPCHPDSLSEAKSKFEKEYLIKALKKSEGNVTRAANYVKRNRTDFYKLMARHNIDPALYKLQDNH